MSALTPRIDSIEANSLLAGSIAQAQGFTNVLDTSSRVSVPFTTIQNRATIVDLANDLGVRMGVERVSFQRCYPIINESGPSGEQVWGAEGDVLGIVRFVGTWQNYNGSEGTYILGNTNSSYVEYTFYGTGLNILDFGIGAAADLRASIDGGAEGSNLFTSTWANILQGRYYNPNQILTVVSGLALGIHTVKIRLNSAGTWNFHPAGFEILNESSLLNVRPGTIYGNKTKGALSAVQTVAYNSGFESGTLNSRGGCALVYLKSDGTIGKAVTPTNSSAAYIASADHTNEELTRVYNWREFGVGRADDFSTLMTSSSSRAFTLDDGTTTLVSTNSVRVANAMGECLAPVGQNDYTTITFVGTGLDIMATNNGGASGTVTVTIDGAAVGAIALSGLVVADRLAVVKVCSGLPYGTHTVKFNRDQAGTGMAINSFKVYSPKKPALPTGAVELAQYYVMADYVQLGSLTGNTDKEKISTGVLRKLASRESVYGVSGWSVGGSPDALNFVGGLNFNGATNGNYYEYTFFGTGIEISSFINGAVQNWTVSIDGSSNLSGYTTSYKCGTTGTTFTASTGTVSGTSAAGARVSLSVTGLSLGKHKITVTRNSGDTFYNDALDIITPIHYPKPNSLTEIQNTYPIGSCSIGDMRKVYSSQGSEKQTAMQDLVASITTTSTVYVPISGMGIPFAGKNKKVRITGTFCNRNATANQNNRIKLYVDGVPISFEAFSGDAGTTYVTFPTTLVAVVTLTPGIHWIQPHWYVSGGTGSMLSGNLLVEEI